MAAHGLTTVAALLPFLDIRLLPNQVTATLHVRCDALRAAFPGDRLVVPFVRSVTNAWPQHWLLLLSRSEPPLPQDTWVRWVSGAHPRFGRILSAPTPVTRTIRIFMRDQMHRLHDTGKDVVRATSRLIPGIAWQGYQSLEDQRCADNIRFGHAIYGEKPIMVWRWQGDLDDGALKLSAAFLIRDPTIVPPVSAPPPAAAPRGADDPYPGTPFSILRNRHIYAALIARLYRTGNAYPSTFLPGGSWEPLVRNRDSRVKHLTVAAVFASAHSPALPFRARQRVYQFHVGGLPVGPRSGSEAPSAGSCPCCRGLAPHPPPDTPEHILISCPLAIGVWRRIFQKWAWRFTNQLWVVPLLLPTDPLRSKPVRLALTLGLRPLGEERDLLPHAFALLRGLAIDAILSKYWHLMASSASTAPPPFLLPLEIASVYSSIQSALSAALRHELRRAENDNQVLLAAGRDIGPDNDAVLKFKQLWIEPGLCDDAGHQCLL